MRIFKGNIIVLSWVLFTWLSGLSAIGQKSLPRDSALIQARYFDQNKINKFKADSNFRYELLNEPSASLWDRFWQWFWNKFEGIFSTKKGRVTFKYSLLVIALAILVLFILQLRKMNSAGLFSASRSGRIPFSVSENDIHGINFELEIANAVTEGNYRLAVRLLYLQSLKKLSDSTLINWQIDKTNLSYLNELKEADFYPLFYRLTVQFENNWYGNIPIFNQEYAEVSEAFTSLNSKISR